MCDKVFEEVTKVIGRKNAVLELAKINDNVNYDLPLCSAFLWEETPQGFFFWDDIHDGDDPYSQPESCEEDKLREKIEKIWYSEHLNTVVSVHTMIEFIIEHRGEFFEE